jgi:hypothetical protein
MRIHLAIAFIALAVGCIAPQRSMAATYNAVTSFNDTGTQPQAGNPFTYGTETTLNGAFTLFSNFGTTSCTFNVCTSNGSVDNYYNSPIFVGPTTGFATNVISGNTLSFSDGLIVIPNNVLVVEPSTSLLNVTRFTAPATGVYNLTGSFSDLQVASVGLSIVANGSTLFSASYDGSSNHQADIPFSIANILLTQGMNLDFVISSGGDQSFDIVGLQAQISQAPLPAALPLFATGLGAMGLLGWWRKRKALV